MPSLLAITVLSVMLIPDYYGERIICEEDWRTPHPENDQSVLSLSISKQNVLVDGTSPHMYFGSSAGGSGNESSGSTDNDDDDARHSGINNDDRKSVKSLTNQGLFEESGSKVIVKNRKDSGIIGYQGRHRNGYGTIPENNQQEEKNEYMHENDVENALQSNYRTSATQAIMVSFIH